MGMDLNSGSSSGKRGRGRPEMNVTPLVDVVLVLLIIFMVLTPSLLKSFWVVLPDEPEDQAESADDGPLVVSVTSTGSLRINAEELTDEAFPERLRGALASRGTRTVVFDAHADVSYGRAVEAIDLAKGAGARNVAVATEALPGLE